MNRSIAIAYTVASAATAIALVVLIGSTVGFGGAFGDDDDDDRAVEAPMSTVVADPRQLANAANAQAAVGASAADEPIVVYEDAPVGRGGWREEDEEEEEHEREERREHHERGERRDD